MPLVLAAAPLPPPTATPPAERHAIRKRYERAGPAKKGPVQARVYIGRALAADVRHKVAFSLSQPSLEVVLTSSLPTWSPHMAALVASGPIVGETNRRLLHSTLLRSRHHRASISSSSVKNIRRQARAGRSWQNYGRAARCGHALPVFATSATEVEELSESLLDSLRSRTLPTDSSEKFQGTDAAEGSVAANQAGLTDYLQLALIPLLWASAIPAQAALHKIDGMPHASVVQLVRMVASCLPYFPFMLQGSRSLSCASIQSLFEDTIFERQPQTRTISGRPMRRTPATGDIVVSDDTKGLAFASLELGIWQVFATTLQLYALESVPIARAGLLLASLNALVPVGAALQGEEVTKKQWLGCLLALVGVGAIEVMETIGTSGASFDSGELLGDALLLLSTVTYAAYTVRLGHFSKRMDSTELSTGKMVATVIVCGIWLAFDAATQEGGEILRELAHQQHINALAPLFNGMQDPRLWGLLAFLGLVPNALATFLQVNGQKHVPTAKAQCIYALYPVWAVLLGVALNGDTLEPASIAGGALVVFAAILSNT
eukprot:scaffold1911_cov397-Prasinococcus_capsulatus_cf.AAC.4